MNTPPAFPSSTNVGLAKNLENNGYASAESGYSPIHIPKYFYDLPASSPHPVETGGADTGCTSDMSYGNTGRRNSIDDLAWWFAHWFHQEFVTNRLNQGRQQPFVDIVAHSMGGLIVRRAMTRPDLAPLFYSSVPGMDLVDDVVVAGTPHNGLGGNLCHAPGTNYAGCTTQERQMWQGSTFVNELNGVTGTTGTMNTPSFADWSNVSSGWNSTSGETFCADSNSDGLPDPHPNPTDPGSTDVVFNLGVWLPSGVHPNENHQYLLCNVYHADYFNDTVRNPTAAAWSRYVAELALDDASNTH